jgi:hypothetical protein
VNNVINEECCVTPCNPVEVHRYFGETFCLHLQSGGGLNDIASKKITLLIATAVGTSNRTVNKLFGSIKVEIE